MIIDFVEAARLERIPPGTGMSLTVAGREVVIFNVDGTIYAMENSSLHKGASLSTGSWTAKSSPAAFMAMALRCDDRKHDQFTRLPRRLIPHQSR